MSSTDRVQHHEHVTPARPADRAGRLPVVRTTAYAAVAALVTWVVLVPLAGVELTARTGPDAAARVVGPVSVVVSTVVVALTAGLVAHLARRRAARPRLVWVVTGTMVLVLSFAGPLGQATTTAAMAALATFHVIVAAVVVPVLARALPLRARRG